MLNRLRNRHLFLLDLILLPLAVYCSFVLRLDAPSLEPYRLGMMLYAATVIAITTFTFRQAGVYSRWWRYASVGELVLLIEAVFGATVIASVVCFGVRSAWPDSIFIPRSIPYIYLLLAIAVTAGPRLLIRASATYSAQRHNTQTATPVGVMGAGDAGAIIVRELQRNPQLGMRVVGLFDDDKEKHGMVIHGIPVLGDRHAIPATAEQAGMTKIIIAMPTAPGREIREITRICERAGVETKTIPGIYELLGGTISVNQLRNVEIADLLRRAPVHSDITAVKGLIRGKRVMVTGGGGSIGSELCRQIWRCEPAQLIMVGHGENSIFEIHGELREMEMGADAGNPAHKAKPPASSRLLPLIVDIRFPERIRLIFEQYRPDIVFHAAAHKHVPLMEVNPAEAITNNVLGTQNLLRAALATGVEHFVMISTDKAVNPTSIMGASKRVAELLVHQAAMKSGKSYVAVRFGNVLGSRGSAIHTFKHQIAAGGPVTITHPHMKRYFMTIPEAVHLVLQASVLGKGGEVFVLDMGEPIRIVDLARDLIELSGLEVGRDIEIVVTGPRPGEKLFEELFIPGESYTQTPHDKIFIAANASSFVPSALDIDVSALSLAAAHNDADAIQRLLRRLIPEYQPTEIATWTEQWEMTDAPQTVPVDGTGGKNEATLSAPDKVWPRGTHALGPAHQVGA